MPDTPEAADHDFNPYESPLAADPAPAPSEPPADTSLPPRGPDGRFLKSDDAPAAPAPRGLSAARRREARQVLGWTDEDIDAASPGEVLITLQNAKHQASRDRDRDGGRAAQAAPPEPGLSPDTTDYDTLVRLVGELQAEVRTLREAAGHIPRMAQYIQAQEQRERVALADELDDFFALHPDVYGPGTYQDVEQDSPEFWDRVAMMKRGLRETRGRTKGLRAALERLHAERYGGRGRPAPREQDDDGDEADRLYAAGRGVPGNGHSRPSSRAGAPPAPGYDAAKAEVGAILNRAKVNADRGRGNRVIPGTLDGLAD